MKNTVVNILWTCAYALFVLGCNRSEELNRGLGVPPKEVVKFQKLFLEMKTVLEKKNTGVIEIPESIDASGVVRRRIFITTVNNSKAILFPTWTGKGANFYGYLLILGKIDDFSIKVMGGKTMIKLFSPSPMGSYESNVTIMTTASQEWYACYIDDD